MSEKPTLDELLKDVTLQQEVDWGSPYGGWQDISTAPKDGTDILVWDGDTVSLCHWDEGWWVLLEFTLDGVTHWMPLPPPPRSNHEQQ